MTSLSEKERQIAAAALRVFARYGLKRTTMNDIAEEAGVVRQTLYNVFANKDEVIHGTLLFYTEMLRQQTKEAWDGEQDLGRKLDLLFKHYILASWDTVRATPDAGDLESGTHVAAKRAMAEADAAMEEMLTELFAPYTEALERNGHHLPDFAALVNAVVMALKHRIEDRDVLLKRLGSLRTMVLSAVA
ncbi:TetR/AcrR family transcriptional regulator [Gymnodinialimonas ceratoperidinii]|uniref:TetR/AcrR family transcriptional regulator n=1 Tax=Gymnodinialimonas ceratoperidinii TaxID=2856823 RepID=A0A8F6TVU2_9RHOB|nr:TetR/AcrR family transcriptional regulator [Gymnodinialimonas ceratoperidinii]QXT39867.1 TetR/AcrR family transcriptional regulator [Gymnodinialimonas ceratoperidinii]